MKRSAALLLGLMLGLTLGGTSSLASAPHDTGVLAGPPLRVQPVEDDEDDGEVPKMPMDQKALECVAKCQQPALRCIERCGEDTRCAARCAERLEGCNQKCGIKLPDDEE